MNVDSDINKKLRQEIVMLKKRISELEQIEPKGQDSFPVKNEGEAILKSISKATPAGMGMLRNRMFVEVNTFLSEMTGYSREELLGKSSRILYTNDSDYELVGHEKYKQLNEFSAVTVETVWKTKAGVLIDILFSTAPIDVNNLQRGVIFTAINITSQKQVQKALQSSEERLKIIFENAPNAIYLRDLKGTIVDGNRAAEKLFGYKKEELIGTNLFNQNVLPTDERTKAMKSLAENEMYSIQDLEKYVLKGKEGNLLSVEISTYPITINKEPLVLAVARDISEREKQEKLKRETEQRIAFHVNQTPLAVIEWDLDLKVKSWNPAAERIFGYSSEEAIGQEVSFIIPESERGNPQQLWSTITSQNGERNRRNKNLHKNGETLLCEWYNTPILNVEGMVVAAASLVRDVTQRVRSEEIQEVIYNISNAANSTENLNKLIRHIQSELSTIIDTTNFHIALYDEASDMLSLPFFADEKDQFDSFSAGNTLSAYVIKNKKALLATQSTMKMLEESGQIERVGTESEIWLGVPLEIEDQVIGILVLQSYNDKTAYSEADMKMLEFVSNQISLSIHRKNSEVEIKRALEKATESDRLKSAFLANMSHEIRTPMNGILGFSNLLKNESLSADDRKRYINIIQESGNRMLAIINDLIDVSKIESGMVEVVDNTFNLNDSIEYIYSFYKPEAEACGLELSFFLGLETKNALISADREKVYAILINLVKNAIKYTKVGKIEFGYRVKNNELRFSVKDSGIGIPENKLKSIFNRFVQADLDLSTSYEGVGLGLAITKAYINLLGGKIWVESEYAKGSTFYFEIPYVKA